MGFMSMLFSFSGRINRAKWWLSILIIVVIYMVVVVLSLIIPSALVVSLLYIAFVIAYLWIALAAGAKRLHDLGRTGAWLVFFIGVPVLLFVVFIALVGMSAGLALIGGGASEAEMAEAFAQTGGLGLIMGVLNLAVWIWALVWFGCLRGTAGPNQYGPDPLAAV